VTFYKNLQTRERRRRRKKKQKGKGNRQTKYRRATKVDKQDHVIPACAFRSSHREAEICYGKYCQSIQKELQLSK
jgi:hypothetical protein